MKLRPDLAQKVTPRMVEEEALANQHRYRPEPLFSQTGTGSLSSASTSDSAAEDMRRMERTRKLMRGSETIGSNDDRSN